MTFKHDFQQDIGLAIHGDTAAFIRLIQAHKNYLYNLARTYLNYDEDCADAVQETIFKSFRSISTLREPAYFKSWLSRILINECIQLLRAQKRMRIIEQSKWNCTTANVPYEAIELKEAVAYLEDHLQIVIQLYYYEDVPIKRIAKLLGVPEGTIKSRLHRARELLAEVLESPHDRRMMYDPILMQERRRKNPIPLLPVVVCERIDAALSCLPSSGDRSFEVAENRFCSSCEGDALMNDVLLGGEIKISYDYSEKDYDYIADNLYDYNTKASQGLLKKPEHDVYLFLKDKSGQVIGGIFCETYNYCLYIDMFWIADDYRGKGYGKAMIAKAESAGKEMGCIFAHTSTFSYQSPYFYQIMGYEIFGILDDYPDGIKQYFLKKKLL
ncbi:GNAT family N-acetyltransferase [Paenibacillus thiaminolyticus]|uniref:GNAT family N-acetyltransferase n=1 Tax=Paenibacillus thiaminolyticus TaxID=49283 RepID=UPI003D2C5A58